MDVMLAAWGNIFTVEAGLVLVAGTLAGMIVGALPGLSSTMGVALCVPITFVMPADLALILLGAVYVSSVYGGSITAILLRAPGTDAAIATAFDGYPMAQQGRAGEAIGMATMASLIGGTFSVIVLLLVAPPLARIALAFGPPEYVLVTVFGLVTIVGVSEGNLLRGFIMAAIGLLLATVGISLFTGTMRFTFGYAELFEGVPFLPILIGLFSVSQAIALAVPASRRVAEVAELRPDERIVPNWADIRSVWRTLTRSSFLGVIIGILPGAGTGIAAFISYNEARRKSKNRDKFGTGVPEGVVASECANNAVTGGTLVPTLTLGIPGNSVTAVFIGGLTIHGLIPGPRLFTDYAEVTYTLIYSLFVANFMFAIAGVLLCRWLVRITVVRGAILGPIIIVFAIVGSYALRNNLFDVAMVLAFGGAGFFLERWRYPIPPLVIGVILGQILESNLIRSKQLFAGDWSLWFTRPLSLFLMALVVLAFAYPIVKHVRKRRLAPADV